MDKKSTSYGQRLSFREEHEFLCAKSIGFVLTVLWPFTILSCQAIISTLSILMDKHDDHMVVADFPQIVKILVMTFLNVPAQFSISSRALIHGLRLLVYFFVVIVVFYSIIDFLRTLEQLKRYHLFLHKV